MQRPQKAELPERCPLSLREPGEALAFIAVLFLSCRHPFAQAGPNVGDDPVFELLDSAGELHEGLELGTDRPRDPAIAMLRSRREGFSREFQVIIGFPLPSRQASPDNPDLIFLTFQRHTACFASR